MKASRSYAKPKRHARVRTKNVSKRIITLPTRAIATHHIKSAQFLPALPKAPLVLLLNRWVPSDWLHALDSAYIGLFAAPLAPRLNIPP
jgi:hypothetical protein